MSSLNERTSRSDAGTRGRPLVAAVIVSVAALAATPVSAGPPFVTDDPDTPDKGHFEINLAGQYARFNGGSTANIPSLEVDYGVLSNLEATILIPLGLSQVAGLNQCRLRRRRAEPEVLFIEEDSWGWRPAVAIARRSTCPVAARRGALAPAAPLASSLSGRRRISTSGPCSAAAASISIPAPTRRTGGSRAWGCCASLIRTGRWGASCTAARQTRPA